MINAAADTAFRMAVGGHRLTVTHTDGFPVEPVDGDALLIGMGERYDLLVTVGDGIIPVVAAAEGKGALARALIRTGTGTPPPFDHLPVELEGRLLAVAHLTAEPSVSMALAQPDRVHRLELGGDMMSYRWTINGDVFDGTLPLEVNADERVRLEFDNQSMMFHPMHLYGHTFQMAGPAGGGARKDTVIVRPGERLVADFAADNPGRWVAHCHNIYYAEAGMMTGITYNM